MTQSDVHRLSWWCRSDRHAADGGGKARGLTFADSSLVMNINTNPRRKDPIRTDTSQLVSGFSSAALIHSSGESMQITAGWRPSGGRHRDSSSAAGGGGGGGTNLKSESWFTDCDSSAGVSVIDGRGSAVANLNAQQTPGSS